MMNELIEKIAAQTGQPVETVTPVVGALLAHLGDVLPAPIAHQLAIFLGVHQDDGTADPAAATEGSGIGGMLAGLAGAASGPDARGAGAAALMSAAQSLLGGFLASRR